MSEIDDKMTAMEHASPKIPQSQSKKKQKRTKEPHILRLPKSET